MLQRRQFLQAACGFAALPATLCAAAKDDGFGGFTMGAQSYCFRNFNTEQALKKTQELGLHHVEFFQKHAPLNSTPAQIKALLKLCGDFQLPFGRLIAPGMCPFA